MTPTLNFELLAQTVKWARYEHDLNLDNPDASEWYQAAYYRETKCGTASCIAGNVALGAGYEPAPGSDAEAYCLAGEGVETSVPATPWLTINGKPAYMWHDIGRVQLGLTHEEAVQLFSGPNTIDDVERIARDIATNYGYTPTW